MLPGILGFLWVAGVVALYYFWHKPVGLSTAAALANSVWHFASALGVLTVCGGLGRLVLREQGDSTVAGACLQAAVGLGIASLVLLLIGAFRGFQGWLLLLLWIFLLLTLNRPARAWWAAILSLRADWAQQDAPGRSLVILVGSIFLLTLPIALSPPLKFDALVYHLTLPQEYLADGGISYLPWLFYWGMPQLAELIFTWLTALAGAQAAATFGWLVGALVMAGVVGMLKDSVSLRAAWVGAAALVAGISIASSLAWAYVGWITMLFGLGLLEALRRWSAGPSLGAALIAGLCAGLALGVKYTAGILIPGGLLALALGGSGRPRARLIAGLAFLGASLLAFSPWIIKNLMATGNPFYPLLFPSGSMTPLRLELFQNQPGWGSGLDTVFLPLRATFLGLEGAPGYSSSIGPLLLGLAVLAVLFPAQPWQSTISRLRITAAGIALAGLIIWAVAGRLSGLLIQTRLYLSIFPALAVLAGIGYHAIESRESDRLRTGWLVTAVTMVVLGLNGLAISSQTIGSGALTVVLGLQSRESYLDANLGWYGLVARELKVMDGARVLMLWEPRSYYCRPVCVPDEILDRWVRDLRGAGDVDAVLQAWLGQGLTHVLINRGGMAFTRQSDRRYAAEEWTALDTLLARLTQEKDYDGVFELYRLSP